MATLGNLSKIRSVLRKLNSFTNRRHSMVAASACSSDESNGCQLYPVYVGKSRRRYLVTSEVVHNPVFRELIDRSGTDESDAIVTIGCEVVLFEHLLWMLENADHHEGGHQDLAKYYAY